jgi:membrane protease YdiL (CAAX protease family)
MNVRPFERLRLFLLLWVAGLPGIGALILGWLPRLVGGTADGAPAASGTLSLAVGSQLAAVLAAAVAVGMATAARCGLHAPVFEAIAARGAVWPALRRQLAPGLAGGIAGGLWLVAMAALTPAPLRAASETWAAPLSVRLLYGGVTEELIVRWGLTSLLCWFVWRVFARRRAVAPPAAVLAAIVAGAAAFGAAHLPSVVAMAGPPDASVVAWVIVGNGVFGLLAGWLYWRRGLEAAIIAHAAAHGLAALLGH